MTEIVNAQAEHAEITREEVEEDLRHALTWARGESVTYRQSDPVRGRAGAMIATHVEDALRVLILPVP